MATKKVKGTKVGKKEKKSAKPAKAVKGKVAKAPKAAEKVAKMVKPAKSAAPIAAEKLSKKATANLKPEVPVIAQAVAPEKVAVPEVVESASVKAKKRKILKAQILAEDSLEKLGKKWLSLYTKTKDVKAEPYNMRRTYQSQTPINHKLLGWGFILDNKNDRLEVLFKDGIKYLISNYKA